MSQREVFQYVAAVAALFRDELASLDQTISVALAQRVCRICAETKLDYNDVVSWLRSFP